MAIFKEEKMKRIHGRTFGIVRLPLILIISFFSFTLTHAHAYPAPQFKQVLLCSSEDGNGSIYTLFYARISGPSLKM